MREGGGRKSDVGLGAAFNGSNTVIFGNRLKNAGQGSVYVFWPLFGKAVTCLAWLILRQVEEQGVGVALAGASGPGALEDGVE